MRQVLGAERFVTSLHPPLACRQAILAEGRRSFEGVGFNRVLDPGQGSLALRPADRPIVCLYCYR
jgi:hypothetical protein